MIPNEVQESKNCAPGRTVTNPAPAFTISLSSFPGSGAGPTPIIPFSDWNTTSIPSGT